MIETRGDIWDYEDTHWIVVPTNIGWTHAGKNVMGRGIARQAAERYPKLAKNYGEFCRMYHGHVGMALPLWLPTDTRLILFPTKPLNALRPAMSWRGKSDLDLINHGLYRLRALPPMHPPAIAVPLLGCGNGGLDPDVVAPLMRRYLDQERFLLVKPK